MSENEEKVVDPTIEWDLKLTRTEWTIFWKSKFEEMLKKAVEARAIINKQNAMIKDLKVQLAAQNGILKQLPEEVFEKAKDDAKAELQERSQNV